MGTALACTTNQSGDVSLWSRNSDHRLALEKERINQKYLPQITIPDNIVMIEGEIEWDQYDHVILAIPTQHLRQMASDLKIDQFKGIVLNSAKGIELQSFKTPCEILADLGLKNEVLYSLSGPSHAEEMSRGIPTSVAIAGESSKELDQFLTIYENTSFRPYYVQDRLGVELGGALKNIIAIAAGISDGLGFGVNTKSAIITRGLSEIKRYGTHRGAKSETFNGLSCLGDLITTCCSPFSRNRAFGEAIMKEPGKKFAKLAEGAWTVKSLMNEIESLDFDMPICNSVNEIAHHGRDPKNVMRELISRPFKEED